ncbi:TlpA family protein disulfide reductase [Thalassotalea euphylliae]|uniref:TlpA family protein disulfide reductase n=1 Tax=Thalassotalea euphylliae TaxID=1655234 RepID=UPI003638EDD9
MRVVIIIFCVVLMSLSSVAYGQSKDALLSQFDEIIAQHKGKIIYVDFWASWCVPCRQAFPWMDTLEAKYSPEKFKVLAVNLDADRSYADTFLSEVPVGFEIFYDAKGYTARSYKIQGMPSSFILDQQGAVVATHVGFNDEKRQQYEQLFEKLLSQ